MVQKERQGPRTSHRQAPLSCASLAITAQTPESPLCPRLWQRAVWGAAH